MFYHPNVSQWGLLGMNTARKIWFVAVSLAVVTTLLYASQMQQARGDPASCLARVASYVAELDQLLAKERNWITPFDELNERYAPFEGCDADALLVEVLRSRFAQPTSYNPRSKKYFVKFSSEDVQVGFSYRAAERRSEIHYAGWTNK